MSFQVELEDAQIALEGIITTAQTLNRQADEALFRLYDLRKKEWTARFRRETGPDRFFGYAHMKWTDLCAAMNGRTREATRLVRLFNILETASVPMSLWVKSTWDPHKSRRIFEPTELARDYDTSLVKSGSVV